MCRETYSIYGFGTIRSFSQPPGGRRTGPPENEEGLRQRHRGFAVKSTVCWPSPLGPSEESSASEHGAHPARVSLKVGISHNGLEAIHF